MTALSKFDNILSLLDKMEQELETLQNSVITVENIYKYQTSPTVKSKKSTNIAVTQKSTKI